MTRRDTLRAITLIALLSGCAKERPLVEGERACISYQEEIAGELRGNCAKCHAGGMPGGGYDVSSYLSVLTDRAGKVVAAAGEPDSLLLTRIDPQRKDVQADPNHGGFATTFGKLSRWVVDCRLSYFRSDVHQGGIMNPADGDFHGKLARSLGYDFKKCAKCHGRDENDFSGGPSGASCLKCHSDAPTGCSTCHGAPPPTGAHLAHAKGATLGRMLDCGECHIKPKDWKDPGHLFDADGKLLPDPPVATINFGDSAKAPWHGTASNPAWNKDTETCTNVYCHGGPFNDANAKASPPKWTGGPSQGECGACHGTPPSDHKSNLACDTCHGKVVDGSGRIADGARHLDGKISLGDESGGCWACHGSPDNPAPPRDLAGSSDPKSLGVGAHAAHLGAAHRLSAPVKCVDCHQVFQKVTDPGHIDSTLPAEVFPVETTAQSVAFKDGAMPAWDRNAATCKNVYCHGNGATLGKDLSVNLKRSPKWLGGSPEAVCGVCHGLPPADDAHKGPIGLKDCAGCHRTTMDETGQVIVTGAPGQETSAHINGVVDVTK